MDRKGQPGWLAVFRAHLRFLGRSMRSHIFLQPCSAFLIADSELAALNVVRVMTLPSTQCKRGTEESKV